MASVARNHGAVSEGVDQMGMVFTECPVPRYGPFR